LPVGGVGVAELEAVDPDALDAAGRVELLVAWSRQLAHVQAKQAVVVASMARRDNDPVAVAGGTIRDPVAEEMSCALNMSAFSAHLLLDDSRTLATRLPNILDLVRAGTVSWAVARVVVDELPDAWSGMADPAIEIERAMLGRVTGRTPAQVRRSAKRVVHRICPQDAADRAKTAARGRGMSLMPRPDAMMTLCALLPAADAQYVYSVIDRAARRRVGALTAAAAAGREAQVPGVDATRADILVELAARLAADEQGADGQSAGIGTIGGPARTVAVVIDLLTALGLAENPGHIPGYGSVPAAVARELALDANWVRWITDPVAGDLLDAGRRTYRPGVALRGFIIARDQYCRFPSCSALAAGATTEIDHAQPFDHSDPDAGGLTIRQNLGALCKRHHQYKSSGLWNIATSDSDGSCEWASPSGHRYPSIPNEVLATATDCYRHEDPWPDDLGEPSGWEPDQFDGHPPERPPEPEPDESAPLTELELRLDHALCA
ncbi:MAG: DUF222 domain-containing protein, partial [Actinomycetes bacterium]